MFIKSCTLSPRSAIDQLTSQHDAHIKEMQRAAEASSQTEELEDLRNTIAERENDLEEALREAESNHKRLVSPVHQLWEVM